MRQTGGDRLCKVPEARGSGVYSNREGFCVAGVRQRLEGYQGSAFPESSGGQAWGKGGDESRDTARWAVGKGGPGYRCVECGERMWGQEAA